MIESNVGAESCNVRRAKCPGVADWLTFMVRMGGDNSFSIPWHHHWPSSSYLQHFSASPHLLAPPVLTRRRQSLSKIRPAGVCGTSWRSKRLHPSSCVDDGNEMSATTRGGVNDPRWICLLKGTGVDLLSIFLCWNQTRKSHTDTKTITSPEKNKDETRTKGFWGGSLQASSVLVCVHRVNIGSDSRV